MQLLTVGALILVGGALADVSNTPKPKVFDGLKLDISAKHYTTSNSDDDSPKNRQADEPEMQKATKPSTIDCYMSDGIAVDETTRPHQVRLINHLLDPTRYDPRVRPVRNVSAPVDVVMRMNLYQILNVMEKTQQLALYLWVTQMWTDEFLGWVPADFGGITWIDVSYLSVWKPDTYLYNSVEMSQSSQERLISVVITADTSVYPPVARMRFMYPAIYYFGCKFNVRYYPFDQQTCNMRFSSWTTSELGINYTAEQPTVLFEDYVSNEEWRVRSFTWHRESLLYDCCPDAPWAMLTAKLVMQRKPLYTLINLVLPSAMIALVAIVGFFMPATDSGERSEKVNLGITTLLAMAILLLMVVESMPATSDFIPLLGWFYLSIILLCSLGTLLTTLVIWLQKQARLGRPVWRPVRWLIFARLAVLLRVPCQPELVDYWLANGYTAHGIKKQQFVVARQRKQMNSNEQDSSPLIQQQLHRKYSLAIRGLMDTDDGSDIEKAELIDRKTAIAYEWEHLADVIDRFLLIVFTCFVIIVTGFVFTFGLMVYGTEQGELQDQH